jgi:ribonuclease HII
MSVFRIGIDENGLGARLGPLIVTGVLAQVDERGERLLRRKLPQRLRADLDDSKRLVSCRNYSLGEAWARALVETPAATSRAESPSRIKSPADLFAQLSLEGLPALRAPCPETAVAQCWHTDGEAFMADEEQLERVRGHVAYLRERGVDLRQVRSSVVCALNLNQQKARGITRFTADLHAMERLVLHFRETAGQEVRGVCGKVGGIAEYSKFFGPLAGRLHVTLEEGRAASAYRFPDLGEIAFVRDADASDPLVMLSSLVGKYVRELLMGRIARFWRAGEELPSGYHDPVTARFVEETATARKRRRLPLTCFERLPDEAAGERRKAETSAKPPSAKQTALF